MIHKMNSLVVATYLLLCIVLGGSAQGVWSNLALQVIGIALLAWSGISPQEKVQEYRAPFALDLLFVCFLIIVLAQLIPVPAAVWKQLPGREGIAAGFAALGYPAPALPISETPYQSVAALFAAIPAIATLIATERLHPSPRAIAAVVIAGTVLSIIIGIVQVGSHGQSWAYFYDFTNPGAVGFFANRNHMATLLLVTIPLAVGLFASVKPGRRSVLDTRGVAAALLTVIMIGIVMNGSIAAYGLVIPVAVASASLAPGASRWRGPAWAVAGVALVAALAVLVAKPIGVDAAEADSTSSIVGRTEIWQTTSMAIRETLPVGTGLGSFAQVYRQHENPSSITRSYVNHAHNDYLEVVLELGAAGALLIVLFLGWWIATSVRIWRSPLSTPFARAATIATAAVLAHSLVDFPLRTAAISTIFAACLGFMAQHMRGAATARPGETRPARHIKLG